MFANCCVWNYAPVEIHGMQITLRQEFSYFRGRVHIKYTSNMVACDVTAPHV